jgi:beta-glucosidase
MQFFESKLMKRNLALLIIISGIIFTDCNRKTDTVNDVRMKSLIDKLISQMTIEEKIGQLSLFTSGWEVTGPSMSTNYRNLIREGRAGNVFNAFTVDYVKELQKIAVEETRLHIPLLFGYDVIHGHRTIFPIPLAQACSWNLEAIEKSDRIAATEATAEGINWVFAPMVDIAHDPRWGRVMEGAGEDPLLGSRIAAARVRGFQGKSLADDNTVLACVKHFAAYGAPQGGRDYNTVDMSERSLREWYLPPYKSAVAAGAGSVMSSFNEIAGIPSSSNQWLLTGLLRNEWGFNGFVVSDYTSINELIPHGVAADSSDAARLAFNAGLDMDMEGKIYMNNIKVLISSGKISMKSLDNSVRLILEAKFKLGLFDDPYKYCNKSRESNEIMTPEDISFARSFAAKSMVLLKNEKGTLPIPPTVHSIAIIGPLGDSKRDMLGSWSAAGDWQKCISLLEGMKNKCGNRVKVTFSKGCDIVDPETSGFDEAIRNARSADYVILALGESAGMSGESASRSDISLPGVQMKLFEAIMRAGKPTVVVLFNGRPLAIPGIEKGAPAVLEAWFGGTEAGNSIADILFGDVNPSGKLTMSFPVNNGQIPVFYYSKNTGRPINPSNPGEKYKSNYLDCPNTPLFPFGFGLSYTTYRYSEIVLNKRLFLANDTIIASVDVTNTGTMNGEEIVQLYVRDLVGDVTRPVKELKGFSRIPVGKGETKTVSFSLLPSDLAYYHQDMSFKWDKGDFVLFIGPSSAETRETRFSIQ